MARNISRKDLHTGENSIAILARSCSVTKHDGLTCWTNPISPITKPMHSFICCGEQNLSPVADYTRPTQKHLEDIFTSIKTLKHFRELAIIYFLRKGSAELKHFYTKSMLKKHTIEKNGIYYSRTRVFAGYETTNTFGDNLDSKGWSN